MNTLVFSDFDGSMNVEYITDLLDTQDNESKFTVMDIRGLNDAEVKGGMSFRQLQYNIPMFKSFARQYDLRLVRIKNDGTQETIVDATDSSPSVSHHW